MILRGVLRMVLNLRTPKWIVVVGNYAIIYCRFVPNLSHGSRYEDNMFAKMDFYLICVAVELVTPDIESIWSPRADYSC